MAKLLTSILVVIVMMSVFVPDTDAVGCGVGTAQCDARNWTRRGSIGSVVICCPAGQGFSIRVTSRGVLCGCRG